jgi:O-antigen/teichoic acid export membrane protein
LGPNGLADTSLFILGLTLSSSISEFYGGANITYLAKRVRSKEIIWTAYLLALPAAALVSIIYYFLEILNSFECSILFISAVMQSIVNTNYHYLSGLDKLNSYNILLLVYHLLLAVFLVIIYNFIHSESLSFFVTVFCCLGLILIFSVRILSKEISYEWHLSLNKAVLKLGFQNQIGVFTQLLNFRLVFFVIEASLGKYVLGLFSLGNQLIEASWIPSKAIATVQYSKFSQTLSKKDIKKSMPLYLLMSFFSTLAILLAVYIVPERIIALIFGEDFAEIKVFLIYLIPGALLLSISRIIGNYFAGQGLHKVNMIASISGFALNAVLVFYLIEKYQLAGAGYLNIWVFGLLLFIQLLFLTKDWSKKE